MFEAQAASAMQGQAPQTKQTPPQQEPASAVEEEVSS